MRQSETIDKLASALVKAQAEMPEIPMDGVNPHYRSKFSTLKAVISATRPVFAKHGLAVLQLPFGDNLAGLTTRIVHESGQWIEETVTMQIGGGANPGQELGKLITYMRRYGLSSAAGVYSDEDTDGEGLGQKQEKKQPERKAPASDRPYNAEQVKAKMAERVAYHLEKQTTASQNDRKVLASILDTVLTDVTKRYELCNWLVGQSSTQKMKQADVNALFDWLGTPKTFNAVPEPHVVKEIHSAHTAALVASGQQELI